MSDEFVISGRPPLTGYKAETNSTDYQILLDDVTTANVTYVGKAPIGAATSDTSWQIKKIDESSTPVTLSVKFAGSGQFNQVWDNRTSLTYT